MFLNHSQGLVIFNEFLFYHKYQGSKNLSWLRSYYKNPLHLLCHWGTHFSFHITQVIHRKILVALINQCEPNCYKRTLLQIRPKIDGMLNVLSLKIAILLRNLAEKDKNGVEVFLFKINNGEVTRLFIDAVHECNIAYPFI